MARIHTHITETRSREIFEASLTRFSSSKHAQGDLLFRGITERDYGIDGQVELFDHGKPTGRIAMIQIKATEKNIEKLKISDDVSCGGISEASKNYCNQNRVPVILVYCSIPEEKYYYIDLQSAFAGINENERPNTVRIPIENNSDDLTRFVDIINQYYNGTGKSNMDRFPTDLWFINRYLGCCFSGVDPWEESFAIEITDYSNKELKLIWSNIVSVNEKEVLVEIPLILSLNNNLIGEFCINKSVYAFDDPKEFLNYSYFGAIQLVEGNVNVTFNGGNCCRFALGGGGADGYGEGGGWRSGANLISVLKKKN